MTEQEKKTTESNEPKPITASDFRAKFVKGELVTAPSRTDYTIRPIAPHFFVNNWSTRLMSFIPKELQGKELTEEQAKKLIPEEEQANLIQAIRPVLCAGVIKPKVIDPKVEDREPLEANDELSVDDLLSMPDDALYLYTEIHQLSRGCVQSHDNFPDSEGSGT